MGLAAILTAHMGLWTIYSVVAQSGGWLHHDMTEAYVWGQSFQLGYYKHPPLYAWIAGLWFEVFPRADWAFYLLSQVNAAIGLAGVWFLAGHYLGPYERLAAVLLLTLAPFHNILAINYNANSALLSIWPWLAFAFVRAMERPSIRRGAAFGLLAALAMLCKYYSVLMLAGCAIASLASPRVKEIYASPAPYAAVATCALAASPHLWWLVTHDWQPIEYAKHTAGYGAEVLAYKTSTTALGSFALLALPALAFVAAFGWQTVTAHVQAVRAGLTRAGAPLFALAATPFIGTVVAGTVGSIKISTNFLIPAFSLESTALLALSRTQVAPRQLRIIVMAALAYPLTMVALSPAIAHVLFRMQVDLTTEPRRELAERVTQLWRDAYGVPLRLVAGSNAYGNGVAFYAPDRPLEFIRLNYEQAPWVTPRILSERGIAIACNEVDVDCVEQARKIMTPQARRVHIVLQRAFHGMTGPAKGYDIFLVPPGDIPPVSPIPLLRLRDR